MSTQITPTTELQAVNIMLSTIGEAPVNTIEGTTNVDVSVAKSILDETSLALQSEGWNFNTQPKYTVTMDDDSKVPLPSNTLQADAGVDYRYRNLIIRNGYLFDVDNNTDTFTGDLPQLDLVLAQQFEQIPEYARRYITMKAARRFASRFIGDDKLTALIQQDEQEALIAFKQADSRSEDNNILTSDANTYSIINRLPRRRY